MNCFNHYSLLALSLLGLSGAPSIAADDVPFPTRWGNALVHTVMTDAGRSLPQPSLDTPVFYLGHSRGCEFGALPGDNLPNPTDMTKFVVDVLKRQGYQGAAPGVEEPSLFIVLEWGMIRPQTHYKIHSFLGYDPDQDIASRSNPGMLGPEVFRRNLRTPEVAAVLRYSQEKLYVVMLTAFDYASVENGEPVLFWQTRIALPARGKAMADALPAMTLAAGSLIGKESTGPMLRDRDDYGEATVELPEIEFFRYGG